jgi:hypothetical protein
MKWGNCTTLVNSLTSYSEFIAWVLNFFLSWTNYLFDMVVWRNDSDCTEMIQCNHLPSPREFGEVLTSSCGWVVCKPTYKLTHTKWLIDCLPYPKVSFHIDKMNFQEINWFLKFEIIGIFHDLLWYCHMSSEIIQSVAYDNNYDDFQRVNFIFSQKFISLFWGLFNDKANLRVR